MTHSRVLDSMSWIRAYRNLITGVRVVSRVRKKHSYFSSWLINEFVAQKHHHKKERMDIVVVGPLVKNNHPK